eukprot:TRINITY_DN2419_c0_g1_i1.p1 TRINITY_DN2419_c0_g1~~TRINITY_DN2419_c0_g1_i1.p1  ORF type:complete len:1063 (-),score=322.49 TRINITY_DN2419_c0_g1_i1:2-3190(-)
MSLDVKKEFSYSRELEKHVQTWIEEVLSIKFSSNFIQSLKTGVILCDLMNKVFPNTIQRIHRHSNLKFTQMENITNFLDALKTKVGMKTEDLFLATDLWDEKNLKQVIDTLCNFAQIIRSKFSYSGPQMLSTAKIKNLWSESLILTEVNKDEENDFDTTLTPAEAEIMDWVNRVIHLSPPMRNIGMALRSGVVLMQVIEKMVNQKNTMRNFTPQPKYLSDYLQNITSVFEFLSRVTCEGMPSGVTARDIASGDKSTTFKLLDYIRTKFDMDYLFQSILSASSPTGPIGSLSPFFTSSDMSSNTMSSDISDTEGDVNTSQDSQGDFTEDEADEGDGMDDDEDEEEEEEEEEDGDEEEEIDPLLMADDPILSDHPLHKSIIPHSLDESGAINNNSPGEFQEKKEQDYSPQIFTPKTTRRGSTIPSSREEKTSEIKRKGSKLKEVAAAVSGTLRRGSNLNGSLRRGSNTKTTARGDVDLGQNRMDDLEFDILNELINSQKLSMESSGGNIPTLAPSNNINNSNHSSNNLGGNVNNNSNININNNGGNNNNINVNSNSTAAVPSEQTKTKRTKKTSRKKQTVDSKDSTKKKTLKKKKKSRSALGRKTTDGLDTINTATTTPSKRDSTKKKRTSKLKSVTPTKSDIARATSKLADTPPVRKRHKSSASVDVGLSHSLNIKNNVTVRRKRASTKTGNEDKKRMLCSQLVRGTHIMKQMQVDKAKQVVRKKIINETIDTEAKFVNSITIITQFLQQLRSQASEHPPVNLSKFFLNIERIQQQHAQMLNRFNHPQTTEDDISTSFTTSSGAGSGGGVFRPLPSGGELCLIFLENIPWIDIEYKHYSSLYSLSNYNIRNAHNTSAWVSDRIKTFVEQQKQVTGLDLISLMVMPIQRVPRYILLLKQLSKYTSDARDKILVKDVISKFKTVMKAINGDLDVKKREVESRTAKIKSMATGGEKLDEVMLGTEEEGRWFEKEVEMEWGNKGQCIVFLFSNVVLVLKKPEGAEGEKGVYKFEKKMYISEVEKVSGEGEKGAEIRLKNGEKTSVRWDKAEERDEWVKTVSGLMDMR